jgi:hypothetical protein
MYTLLILSVEQGQEKCDGIIYRDVSQRGVLAPASHQKTRTTIAWRLSERMKGSLNSRIILKKNEKYKLS